MSFISVIEKMSFKQPFIWSSMSDASAQEFQFNLLMDSPLRCNISFSRRFNIKQHQIKKTNIFQIKKHFLCLKIVFAAQYFYEKHDTFFS